MPVNYKEQMKDAGITEADFGRIVQRGNGHAFADVPADYKPIGIKELAMAMLAEERKKNGIISTDAFKKDVAADNPSKVKDTIKAEPELPKEKAKKDLSPADASHSKVDAQSKHKNIKLAGLVPANVKRNKDGSPESKTTDAKKSDNEMAPVKETSKSKK